MSFFHHVLATLLFGFVASLNLGQNTSCEGFSSVQRSL